MSTGLAAAALAWACTPQAYISLSRSSGPAGTVVTVTGEKFVTGGRVEIRTGGVDSVPLATATGPSFSVSVSIPQDAAPGSQLIGATGYGSDGQAEGTATRPFLVTAPAAPKSRPVVAPPAPQRQPTPTHRPATVRPQPSVATHRAPRVHPAPAVHATAPAAGTVAPTAPAVSVAPAAPAVRVAPPVAPAPVRGHAQHQPAPRPGAARHAAPHAAPVARPRHAAEPAWAPTARPADTASGGGGRLAIGIGLLAAGLVALFAGFAVAEARRRRAPVRRR